MTIAERKARFEAWRGERALGPITRHYLDGYLADRGASPLLREARALLAYCARCELPIDPGEEIVGLLTWREPLIFHYGGGTVVKDDLADAFARQEGMDGAAREEFLALLGGIRAASYIPANPDVYSDAENLSVRAHAATSTWFAGHMVPDYERVLAIGLGGYAREIEALREEHPDRAEFYGAMEAALSALRTLLLRYADAASALGMGVVAANLRHVAARPPDTFHQAAQLVWMLHMLNGADSFGRADGYLHPFYERDVRESRLDAARAAELVAELLIKVEAAEQIQNMTLGGVDGSGRDFYPPLTRMIIDVTRELGYKGPNLCLRVTGTMPREVWDAAMESLAAGNGLPALYNDGLYTESLVAAGLPVEVARGYSFAGCSQLMLPGMCNFVNDIGMFNAAKVAEIALYGGFDPRTGARVGPGTPPAAQASAFGDLLEAFYRQLDYFIDIEISMHEKELAYRAATEGYALRTLFTRDCLASGKAVFEGGARYNHLELEAIGITNCADHLWALREVVFERGLFSIGEVVAALRADFAGCEPIRRALLAAPKFGNDHEGVDGLRAEISRHIYGRFNDAAAPLGGVFVPGEVIFTAHDHCGAATGATADGRRAGEVLADSAGASQGRDVNGPTALMNSVLRIPVRGALLTSVVLNLRFLPSLMEGGRREAVRLLLDSYLRQGGMQLQVNVCDVEMLKAAQREPEKHRSLIVRVGGYSDYFTRLPAALQDEIIRRTAQEIA